MSSLNIKFLGGTLNINIVGKTPIIQHQQRIIDISRRAKNMKPVMDAWGRYMLTSIYQNFKAEGRPRKWEKLKDVTIRDRLRRGFGAGPILQRTQKLIKSFRYIATSKFMRIYGLEYGIYHQKGGSRLPQRIIVELQTKDREVFIKMVNKWVFKGS